MLLRQELQFTTAFHNTHTSYFRFTTNTSTNNNIVHFNNLNISLQQTFVDISQPFIIVDFNSDVQQDKRIADSMTSTFQCCQHVTTASNIIDFVFTNVELVSCDAIYCTSCPLAIYEYLGCEITSHPKDVFSLSNITNTKCVQIFDICSFLIKILMFNYTIQKNINSK